MIRAVPAFSRETHPFPPVFDARSRVLILGSFPSPRSRAEGFYYGHPQNRFWRVLAALTASDVPATVAQKRAMLLKHGVALWDAAAACDVAGASDAALRNARANDVSILLRAADIRVIAANGATAARLYRALIQPETGREIVPLPSTSAANAAWSLSRLTDTWRDALDSVLKP